MLMSSKMANNPNVHLNEDTISPSSSFDTPNLQPPAASVPLGSSPLPQGPSDRAGSENASSVDANPPEEEEEEVEPPKLKRGPWSAEEDQKLLELVQQNRSLRWVKIAKLLGTRTSKQCRERYHQNLKPSLNHRPITEEEGKEITRLVGIYGKRWAAIARHLQGRSDNTIKNWWNAGANRRRLELNSQVGLPPPPGSAEHPGHSEQPGGTHPHPHQQQPIHVAVGQRTPYAPATPGTGAPGTVVGQPVQAVPMPYGYPAQAGGYPYYQIPGQQPSGYVPAGQYYQMQQPQYMVQGQFPMPIMQEYKPDPANVASSGTTPIYMTTMPRGYPSQMVVPMQVTPPQLQAQQQVPQQQPPPVPQQQPHQAVLPQPQNVQPVAASQIPPSVVPPSSAASSETVKTVPVKQEPPSQGELSPGSIQAQSGSPRGRRNSDSLSDAFSDALSPTQVRADAKPELGLGIDVAHKPAFGSLFKASYAEPAPESTEPEQSATTQNRPLTGQQQHQLPGPMSLFPPSHAIRHRLSVDHSPYRRTSLEELSRRSIDFSSRPSTPDSRRSSVLHSSEFSMRKASTSWAPPESGRRHSAIPELPSQVSSGLGAGGHIDAGRLVDAKPPFVSATPADAPQETDRSRRVSIANLMAE